MTSSNESPATAEKDAGTRVRNPAAVLVVAAFAAFLATFNETFLNVGFSPIMVSTGVDVSTVQWLATGYMLGAAVMVPVSAFAYRSFPTRPLFCATTVLLVAGSVIGALAPSFAVLLVGRIVQALGTGMLIPIGMNITLEVAPREKLGTYMGIMGAMTTLGPSSSVILAGLILSAADWRALLWTFAGLSALCLLLGAAVLRNVAHLTHPRLDAVSVAMVGVALVGILYGVSTVFGGNVLAALAAVAVGIVSLVAFVRRQNRLPEPLINLKPLTIAPFTVGVVVNMLSLLTIFAMNILVPTFLQSVLGTQSLTASLILFPAILCSCVVSPMAGRVYDRFGPGVLLPAGFALIVVFSVATSALIPTAPAVVLALLYIPVICGSALVIGPVQSFALSKLPPELNPHGVTIMSTGFQIAGCIGSSVFVGAYSAVAAANLQGGADTFGAYSQAIFAAGALVGVAALCGFALSLWIRRASKTASVQDASRMQGAQGAAAMEIEAASASAVPCVATLMKRDVYTVSCDALVVDALALFCDKGISGAPVVDGSGRVVGFISDGDVMGSLADKVPAFKSAYSFLAERGNEDFDGTVGKTLGRKVGDVATKSVIAVQVSDDLGEVARVLAERHLKKVPVLDGGKMVGVINRSNITRYAVTSYLSDAQQER